MIVACALALASAAVAQAVPGLVGTPAGRRLAARVLETVRHVPSVTLTSQGGLFECPGRRAPRGIFAGRRPSRGCRRARVLNQENLRDGRIAASEIQFSAPGFPTRTTLTVGSGAWRQDPVASCWRRIGRSYHPFAFSYAGQRLSIAGRSHGTVDLRAVGLGGVEIDQVDARTAALHSITIAAPIRHLGTSVQHTTVTYFAAPQTIPSPTPRCPGQPDILLAPGSSAFDFGASVTLRVTPLFPASPVAPYQLFVSSAPYRHFVGEPVGSVYGDSNTVEVEDPGNRIFTPRRNFRAYIVSGAHRSATISVPVVPHTDLQIARLSDPSVSVVTYQVEIHPVRPRPRAQAYIYYRVAGTHDYVLVGSPRLRVTRPPPYSAGVEYLRAALRFRSGSAPGRAVVCLRHQLVSDMGIPFHDRRCGVARSVIEP